MRIESGVVIEPKFEVSEESPWEVKSKSIKPITEPGHFVKVLSGIQPGIVVETEKPTAPEIVVETYAPVFAATVSGQPWIIQDYDTDGCFYGPFATKGEAEAWIATKGETEDIWEWDIFQLVKPT